MSTKTFWAAAGIRALRTFCQTFIAVIGTAQLFSEVNWIQVLSASGLAAILSIATSIATGLPEVQEVVKVVAEKKAEQEAKAEAEKTE